MTPIQMINELITRAESARSIAADIVGYPFKGLDKDDCITIDISGVGFERFSSGENTYCHVPLEWLEMSEDQLREVFYIQEQKRKELKMLDDAKKRELTYQSRKATYEMLKKEFGE